MNTHDLELLAAMNAQLERGIPILSEQKHAIEAIEKHYIEDSLIHKLEEMLNAEMSSLLLDKDLHVVYVRKNGVKIELTQDETTYTSSSKLPSIEDLYLYHYLGLSSKFMLKDMVKTGMDLQKAFFKVKETYPTSVESAIRSYSKEHPTKKLFDVKWK